MVNSCAGDVRVPDLARQGQVIAQKPMQASGGLQIEFEGAAHIRRTDTGGRHAGPEVQKRDPARPRSEVVTNMRCEADYIFGRRRILCAAEQFQAAFKIAPKPMAFAKHATEHVTVAKAHQRKVMSLLAAEGSHAGSHTGLKTECPRLRQKTFTDTALPDGGFGRNQLRFEFLDRICGP